MHLHIPPASIFRFCNESTYSPDPFSSDAPSPYTMHRRKKRALASYQAHATPLTHLPGCRLVNLASTSGYTPLHYAAASHSYEAAAALLRHGADLCVRTWQVGFEFVQLDRGSTPVHAAARYQNLDVTMLLLKHWDEHLRLHDVPDPRVVENIQRIKPYQLPGVKLNQALARVLNPATAMADITGDAGVLISPGKRSAPAKPPLEGSETCHPLTLLQRQVLRPLTCGRLVVGLFVRSCLYVLWNFVRQDCPFALSRCAYIRTHVGSTDSLRDLMGSRQQSIRCRGVWVYVFSACACRLSSFVAAENHIGADMCAH